MEYFVKKKSKQTLHIVEGSREMCGIRLRESLLQRINLIRLKLAIGDLHVILLL